MPTSDSGPFLSSCPKLDSISESAQVDAWACNYWKFFSSAPYLCRLLCYDDVGLSQSNYHQHCMSRFLVLLSNIDTVPHFLVQLSLKRKRLKHGNHTDVQYKIILNCSNPKKIWRKKNNEKVWSRFVCVSLNCLVSYNIVYCTAQIYEISV